MSKDRKQEMEINKLIKTAKSVADAKYGFKRASGTHYVSPDEQDDWSRLFLAEMNKMTSAAGLRIL